ncbi:hypothetical protein Tco_1125596 [Tanacetum coccineum]|uniref:Uncharacterized protein n=1 Tax=Tanacetum coccineum TaxID=301880 RepID=A0ABQ5JA39_9ASTR
MDRCIIRNEILVSKRGVKISLNSRVARLRPVSGKYMLESLLLQWHVHDSEVVEVVADQVAAGQFYFTNNGPWQCGHAYSMMKIKILDASGPLGLLTLLGGASDTTPKTTILALSFSPDGEVLLQFQPIGFDSFLRAWLMIKWWSLRAKWWKKLSRNLVPVQCTKLIFVPPWEGFFPTSTRSSVMASVMGNEKHFSQAMSTYCFKIVETLIIDIEPDVHMKKAMNEINTNSPLSWDKIASECDRDGIEDNRKEEQ